MIYVIKRNRDDLYAKTRDKSTLAFFLPSDHKLNMHSS